MTASKSAKNDRFPVFEFYRGISMLEAGKKPDGTPRTALVIEYFRVTSAAEARALMKAHPMLATRCRRVTADESEPWPKKKGAA